MKHISRILEKYVNGGGKSIKRSIVVCVLVGGLLAAVPTVIVSAPGDMTAQQTTQAESARQIRLDENSILALYTTYRTCGHTLAEREPMSSSYIGLTLDEISVRFPDWQAVAFSGTGAELKRTLNLPCPEHYVLTLESDTLYIRRTVDDSLIDVNSLHLVREGLSTSQLQGLMHGWLANPDQVEAIVEDLES